MIITEQALEGYVDGLIKRRYSWLFNLIFQGYVTSVLNSAAPWRIQLRRPSETTADGNTYVVVPSGYTPAVGDLVACLRQDEGIAYVFAVLSGTGTGTAASKPRVLTTASLSGPWPASTTFTPARTDSTTLIMVSGTGYVGSIGMGTLVVNLDSNPVGVGGTMYFNTANVHQMLPTVFAASANLTATSHTIQVASGTGLSSDANDRASVMVLELPA